MVKKCDITIGKTKNVVSVIVRNGWETEITKTGYIRIGFSSQNKNRMYFMAADAQHGWKLSPQTTTTANYKTLIRDDKVSDGMLKFIGDYDIEVSEDNLCFIDRRNVL